MARDSECKVVQRQRVVGDLNEGSNNVESVDKIFCSLSVLNHKIGIVFQSSDLHQAKEGCFE